VKVPYSFHFLGTYGTHGTSYIFPLAATVANHNYLTHLRVSGSQLYPDICIVCYRYLLPHMADGAELQHIATICCNRKASFCIGDNTTGFPFTVTLTPGKPLVLYYR
jgi:hypothetical protein